MIEAHIVLDSISPEEHRLTTFKLRYPRFIHDELMTHRVFSRNASSLRAIPTQKLIDEVLHGTTAVPEEWGKNRKGMSSSDSLSDEDVSRAFGIWTEAKGAAVSAALALNELGAHKQMVNRLLMPFIHINVVVTATEYMNFFGLRLDREADPTIRALAEEMWGLYQFSIPEGIEPGTWHLPFWDRDVGKDSSDLTIARQVSVARCARTSYQSFETGRQSTVEEDLKLYDRLLSSSPIHASPAEHQATPDHLKPRPNRPPNQTGSWPPEPYDHRYRGEFRHPDEWGNFTGWRQYRKMLAFEDIAQLPEEYR